MLLTRTQTIACLLEKQTPHHECLLQGFFREEKRSIACKITKLVLVLLKTHSATRLRSYTRIEETMNTFQANRFDVSEKCFFS